MLQSAQQGHKGPERWLLTETRQKSWYEDSNTPWVPADDNKGWLAAEDTVPEAVALLLRWWLDSHGNLAVIAWHCKCQLTSQLPTTLTGKPA